MQSWFFDWALTCLPQKGGRVGWEPCDTSSSLPHSVPLRKIAPLDFIQGREHVPNIESNPFCGVASQVPSLLGGAGSGRVGGWAWQGLTSHQPIQNCVPSKVALRVCMP